MSARYGPQYYPSPKILLYMEKAENRPKSFTFVNFLWLCYTNARGEVKL